MNSDRRRRTNNASSRLLHSVGSFVSTAVFAYGVYRLGNWAWEEWNNDIVDDDGSNLQRGQAHIEEPEATASSMPSGAATPRHTQQHPHHKWRLRRQRLERCREETLTALDNFLPTLRRAIEECTDVSHETRALKQLRAQKRNGEAVERGEEKELWDILKVQAFTRMIATAYAHTILFLVLTVQVHLLGGRLLDEQMQNQASTQSLGDDSVASYRMGSYQASHKLVLTKTYEHFFQSGIASLVQTVERSVADVLQDWDVTDPSSINTSRDMVEHAIDKVRDSVEGRVALHGRRRRRASSQRPRNMLRFLLPPEHQSTWNSDALTDELAQSILDETWDLLESPVLEDAWRDSLRATFDLMRDQHWGTTFVDSQDPRQASPQFGTKPLARLVTQLKHSSNSFYEPSEAHSQAPRPPINSYVSVMERMPTILELGDVSFN